MIDPYELVQGVNPGFIPLVSQISNTFKYIRKSPRDLLPGIQGNILSFLGDFPMRLRGWSKPVSACSEDELQEPREIL